MNYFKRLSPVLTTKLTNLNRNKMAKQKYCETLKPGFYLRGNRCIFITGTTKGNKWISLEKRSTGTIYDIPDWQALMWNAINSLMMEGAEYHANNPTGYDINDKTIANVKMKMEKEARKSRAV